MSGFKTEITISFAAWDALRILVHEYLAQGGCHSEITNEAMEEALDALTHADRIEITEEG